MKTRWKTLLAGYLVYALLAIAFVYLNGRISHNVWVVIAITLIPFGVFVWALPFITIAVIVYKVMERRKK